MDTRAAEGQPQNAPWLSRDEARASASWDEAKKKASLDQLIYEDARFSAGGGIAAGLLVLFQLAMIVGLAAQKNAVQEAALGTFWIAINIVLGCGAVIGRRRSYRVYNIPPEAQQPQPMPE